MSYIFFDIHGKLDLEKLVLKLSISAQLPETSDLLCPKPFENLVLRPQSEGYKILNFQMTAATATTDKLSSPDPGPSQRTQERNTSARKSLAVDQLGFSEWTPQHLLGRRINSKLHLTTLRK